VQNDDLDSTAVVAIGVITLNIPRINENARNAAVDAAEVGASILGHEGNPVRMKNLETLEDRWEAEISGSTTQETVLRGNGTQQGLNWPNGSTREERIRANAQRSVTQACSGSGANHPSCN